MERRFAAILAADIVGCSRRLQKDEPGGICIAPNVYKQGKEQLHLTFEHLGE